MRKDWWSFDWGDFLIIVVAGVVVFFVLLLGTSCVTDEPSRREHFSKCPVTTVKLEVPVNCMSPPPELALPSWPTPDRLGNFLLHRSTAMKLKDDLRDLRVYIAEQYSRCARASNDVAALR